MSKRLTSDQSKIDLVAKLVKEGHIDFTEAIKLLEVELEYRDINRGAWQPIPKPIGPWQTPPNPFTGRGRHDAPENPFKVTCTTVDARQLTNVPHTYTN